MLRPQRRMNGFGIVCVLPLHLHPLQMSESCDADKDIDNLQIYLNNLLTQFWLGTDIFMIRDEFANITQILN